MTDQIEQVEQELQNEQHKEQREILRQAVQDAARAARIAADAAHRAGDAAERIRAMMDAIMKERAIRKAKQANESNFPLQLPEMHLHPVATIGPCQVLAVTADEQQTALDYVLAAEAMAEKNLTIKEIGGGGSVPRLQVRNKLKKPVLILEGDLLIGGKQNRLSNSSVLIPQKTKISLPVSCIEHGRWGRRNATSDLFNFGQNDQVAPSSFDSSSVCLAAPISRELKRAKMSDTGQDVQTSVWNSISKLESACAYHSDTSDHEELLRVSRGQLEEFLESTRCPEDAIGIAVVVGDHSYSFDLFDQHATCDHYWQMKVHAGLMHRRQMPRGERLFSSDALEQDVQQLNESRWIRHRSRDNHSQQIGHELHTQTDQQSMATALAYEDLPVHVSLLSQH